MPRRIWNVDEVADLLAETEKQRDELLAALKMIDLSDYEIIYAIGTDAVRAILAAVAKAEGRQ